MAKISVVINTLNEEKNLPRAIASVKGLANEIVICDMESEDRTVDLAKSLGAKVFTHGKTGYVEPARNFAVSKASNPWVLVLDADEEVPDKLALKISQILKNPKAHAVPMTQGTGGEVEAKEEFAVIHHNYDSIEDYLARMNRYSSEHAILKVKEGYKFSWKDLIIKPLNEFLSRYFFGEGYKDGLHGLALSLLQAFSELTVYLKIWQKDKFTDQNPKLNEVISVIREEGKNLHYWESDALFKESGNLSDRIRRKFKI
ncbi:MAG: glycosyltransferase family 2 protein [Candidatus Woesebacteria bacterium]|nr:glycosyltransferase family 2 protein [Candidatus Woesebacteria bacterium]